MLVLARRLNEKVLLPTIDTTIQIVSVRGKVVRLGIDAPPGVTILREELKERSPSLVAAAGAALADPTADRLRALRHLVRNRLNGTAIGLALLRKQANAQTGSDLDRTIGMIEEEVQMLRQRLEKETTPIPPPAPAAAPNPRKALLVEDNRNECELLAGLLRLSGFAVDTAGDGCDALDHLQSGGRPDVVLLDMGLPRCDGATTAREIRRNPAYNGMRIFAVSGHSPNEYGLDQGPALIDRWFQKPIDPAVLLRELTDHLARV
jgi:carbon storage regulator CsrA